MADSDAKHAIAVFLSYPYPAQLPYLSSLAYLDAQIAATLLLLRELDDKFVDEEEAVDDAATVDSAGEDGGAEGEEGDGAGDEQDGQEEEEGQSHFAWFADFVVVINAMTMAAQVLWWCAAPVRGVMFLCGVMLSCGGHGCGTWRCVTIAALRGGRASTTRSRRSSSVSATLPAYSSSLRPR